MNKINTIKTGITLIALVITIVILLILAGITINLTIGEDGIIKRAEQTGGEYANAATSEREQLAELTNRTDEIITNVTESNKPKEKIIEIELKGEKEQTIVPVNLSLEVKTDGEKITNYKWVLNSEREEIGIEEAKYTEEVVNEENTELKISEAGTYYLHVLTTEDNGVKKETVKGPISVNISYHQHIGNSSVAGGCYKSTSSPCSGTNYALEKGTESGQYYENGEPIWKALSTCTVCKKQFYDYGVAKQQVGQTFGSCRFTITKIVLGCGKTTSTLEGVSIEY